MYCDMYIIVGLIKVVPCPYTIDGGGDLWPSLKNHRINWNIFFTKKKKSHYNFFLTYLEFDSNAGEPGFKLFSSSFSSTLSLVIEGSLMAALGLSPDLSSLSAVSSMTTSSSSSETLSLFSGFWASFCSSLALLLIVGLGISVLLRPL